MADNHDADIDTAVADFDGEQRRVENLTVLGLLQEMQEANRIYETVHYPIAVNNERFVHGQQIIRATREDPNVVDESLAFPSWLPPIVRNMMRNLSLTKRAQMISGSPSVKAWPNEAGPNDPAMAAVGNHVLEYGRNRVQWPNMLSRASGMCEPHGAVGFRVVWDPESGPVSFDGERLGEPTIEAMPIFDWGMSATRVEESEWCFFRRYFSRARARSMLLSAGITEEPATSDRCGTWADEKQDEVEAYELWYLPTQHRIPAGLHAIVVGGILVMHEPFPYDHAELPLGVWYCNEKDGWPYGDTHVTDACPVQANINRLEAAKTSVLARTAMWMKFFAPKKLVDAINGGNQVIGLDDASQLAMLKVFTVDNAPTQSLDSEIATEREKLLEVYGINEAVLGSDASATKNARHLQYVAELDGQKNAITRLSLNDCNVRVWRQYLRLCQQFVVDERLIRIVGPQGEPFLAAFRGADIDGLDVILEAAPGTDQTKAAKALEAEELAAGGYLDPRAAAERRVTGLDSTTAEAVAEQQAFAQAQQAIDGMQVAPDPSIPVAVAEGVLLFAIGEVEANGFDAAALHALLQGYRAAAAQQAAQAQQPQQVEALPQPEQSQVVQ